MSLNSQICIPQETLTCTHGLKKLKAKFWQVFVRFSFSLNCINTLVFIEHSSSDQENIRKVNILNLHLEGVFGDESFGETRN